MEKEKFLKFLDKYLSGDASLEEEQTLLNFYGSFNKSSDDIKLQDQDQLGDKMLDQLLDTIHGTEIPKTKSRFILIKTLAIAAILLLTITTGIYFYISSPELSEEQFTEVGENNDILPGYNKATLTLADGSTISLDDAANGPLASQGNIEITKTENGQIVYENINRNGKNNPGHSVINTIQTPKGGKFKVTLPDGSKVWLNSASTLSYPTAFSGTRREVKLKGEAYFEIAHNKLVPFRVESNSQIVEVLGTHFNINSYDDEEYTKTTLLEGSVRVILNSSKKDIANTKLLKPGEQSQTNSTQSAIRIENTDTEKAIAWKNGYFKFKNTPIREIMREIERWYDVDLVYEGKIPTDEFTGFISNDVKLSGVLKILEQSGGVKFTVKGKKIKVKIIQ